MQDLAQQILSPVPVDNSVKALAWDAFTHAKDQNDLAARLKLLGIPDNVKADLWDAKAGNYSPAPNAGLGGVARPDPIPQQPSAIFRFLQSAGIPTSGEDAKSALSNAIAPQASTDHPGFGQTIPLIGPAFRAQRETYDQPGAAAKVYGSIPFVGAPGYRMGQQLQSKDYAGAAGSAANIITQLLGLKGTNLTSNLSAAANTLGDAATAVAPAAGKAAGAGVVGSGIYKTATTGNPEYLLSALAQKTAQRATQGAVSGIGTVLNRLSAAMRSTAPAGFESAAASRFLNSPGINGEPEIIPPPKRLTAGATPLPQSSLMPSGASEGVLPAARKILPNGNIQYLTRPLAPGEVPAVAKLPDTPFQAELIRRAHAAMDQQFGASVEDFQAADQRMAETAKSPWDKYQASSAKPSATAAAPTAAYRVRDVGEKGIMPRGHAQATLDQTQATDPNFIAGRAVVQNSPQEVVKVDLSKLDPSEYVIEKKNGQEWVRFTGPVPESFISKVPKIGPFPAQELDMSSGKISPVSKDKGAGPSPSATPQGQQAELSRINPNDIQAVRYVRYGDVPASGYSRNAMDNSTLPGVSVYRQVKVNGQWINDSSGIGFETLGLKSTGKPLFEVSGDVLPEKGPAGEPLLANAKVVGKIKGHVADLPDSKIRIADDGPTSPLYFDRLTGEFELVHSHAGEITAPTWEGIKEQINPHIATRLEEELKTRGLVNNIGEWQGNLGLSENSQVSMASAASGHGQSPSPKMGAAVSAEKSGSLERSGTASNAAGKNINAGKSLRPTGNPQDSAPIAESEGKAGKRNVNAVENQPSDQGTGERKLSDTTSPPQSGGSMSAVGSKLSQPIEPTTNASDLAGLLKKSIAKARAGKGKAAKAGQ